MKLSNLEELVARMRATATLGTDPDVNFWIREPLDLAAVVRQLNKGKVDLVELELVDSLLTVSVAEHTVQVVSEHSTNKKGDFSLPLEVIQL